MSSNSVSINASQSLSWEVPDSRMVLVLEILEAVGEPRNSTDAESARTHALVEALKRAPRTVGAPLFSERYGLEPSKDRTVCVSCGQKSRIKDTSPNENDDKSCVTTTGPNLEICQFGDGSSMVLDHSLDAGCYSSFDDKDCVVLDRVRLSHVSRRAAADPALEGGFVVGYMPVETVEKGCKCKCGQKKCSCKVSLDADPDRVRGEAKG